MSFWGNQRWITFSTHSSNLEIVSNFNKNYKNRLKDGCYKLTIGEEVILSVSPTETGEAYKHLEETDVISLKPGQFAYLITHETVKIPFSTLGFINIATSIKLKGLVNISGFHVDPGYKGKLIFTVFNAGPVTITLYKGLDIFRLWLCDYDGVDGDSRTQYQHLPRDLADGMNGPYPSSFSLAARIEKLERATEEFKISRWQVALGIIFIVIFLLPFTAALYGALYSAWIAPLIKNINFFQ